jgi:hypothetical protein
VTGRRSGVNIDVLGSPEGLDEVTRLVDQEESRFRGGRARGKVVLAVVRHRRKGHRQDVRERLKHE